MRFICALFLVAVAIIMSPFAALAQESQTAVAPSSFLYNIWTVVQPIVTVLVTIAGPIIAAFIAGQIIKLLNITDVNQQKYLEEQIKAAIHAAATNGLKAAVTAKTGNSLKQLTDDDVIKSAVDYIKTMNPDAVKAANLSSADLTDIVRSKVPDVGAVLQAASGATPVVTAVSPTSKGT